MGMNAAIAVLFKQAVQACNFIYALLCYQKNRTL